MPDPTDSGIAGHEGRVPLERDDQQWVLDYLIKTTGRPSHFESDSRSLPKSVKSHAMIPKHVGKRASALEGLASAELAAGHAETALAFFFDAASTYARAQHGVFALNEEKRFLCDGLRRCYARVAELAPYAIERIEIPWESGSLPGVLHLHPTLEGPAPVVFYIPGCDVTKESWPHPLFNQAHMRGMHVFSFDGPGQGEAILQGLKLTSTNYEEAASLAVDELVAHPAIDPDNVVLFGLSFGSFWALRLAARDSRFRAVVAPQASICDKWILTDIESPRWKQLFAFISGAETEKAVDELAAGMTMHGYMGEISAPTLLTVGEYDPRSPLREIYQLFEAMTARSELWVMSDQHHHFELGGGGPGWGRTVHSVMLDWLRDRIDDRPLSEKRVLYVDDPAGPNSSRAKSKRWWYEEAN